MERECDFCGGRLEIYNRNPAYIAVIDTRAKEETLDRTEVFLACDECRGKLIERIEELIRDMKEEEYNE